jgi:hypothetical protein
MSPALVGLLLLKVLDVRARASCAPTTLSREIEQLPRAAKAARPGLHFRCWSIQSAQRR